MQGEGFLNVRENTYVVKFLYKSSNEKVYELWGGSNSPGAVASEPIWNTLWEMIES